MCLSCFRVFIFGLVFILLFFRVFFIIRISVCLTVHLFDVESTGCYNVLLRRFVQRVRSMFLLIALSLKVSLWLCCRWPVDGSVVDGLLMALLLMAC